MSIAVALDELAATAARFGPAAYVLTSGADGRPHVSHVRVDVHGARITFAAGRGTRANAAARPAVVVLWPPHEDGGFSLIADATASASEADDALVLDVIRAVLHRPA
jgi:hypothetical protein